MRNTFFDRTMTRGSRIALVGGLIGFLAVACSDKPADSTGDDPGTAGTDTSTGAGGDEQGSAGSVNPTTGTGGQAAAGSSGSGGAGKAGASGGGGSDVIVDAGPRVGPLKIMALGDSTTEYSCFRAELAKLLDVSHPKGYQFVGTKQSDFGGCGGYVYDKHNQGMSAYLVTKTSGTMMNTQAEAPTWAALKPDVLLLHFATNDAWNSIAADKILIAWTYLVGEFRKANPRITILAAQVIPLDPMDADGGRSCRDCPTNVTTLNAAIPAWATGLNTAASRIIVVDQWTGYVAATDSCAPGRCDGVHPGPSGSVKMAAKWDEKLEPLF